MLIDCHNHLGIELHQYLRGEFPYAQQFSNLLEDGARNGIGRFVVFPMVTNFAMNLRELCVMIAFLSATRWKKFLTNWKIFA